MVKAEGSEVEKRLPRPTPPAVPCHSWAPHLLGVGEEQDLGDS